MRLTRLLAAADGDHAFSRQEDLLRFFLEMERFLTRYLDAQQAFKPPDSVCAHA